MTEEVITIDSKEWTDFSGSDGTIGVQIQRLTFNACEAVLVRYKPGAVLPRHSHSDETLSVILSGVLRIEGSQHGPGTLLRCKEPYGPRTVDEEVVLLVLQGFGTRYVAHD